MEERYFIALYAKKRNKKGIISQDSKTLTIAFYIHEGFMLPKRMPGNKIY